MHLHFCYNFLLNEMFSFSSFIWKIFPFFFPSSSFSDRHKSSQRRCSIVKRFYEKFATFTGKHLCRSHFLIKLQTFRTADLQLYQKVVPAQVFSWECSEFLTKPFYYRTPPLATFMSIRKGRRRKKERKNFSKKNLKNI